MLLEMMVQDNPSESCWLASLIDGVLIYATLFSPVLSCEVFL